ncbi:hypothetical protein Tco_0057636 [Tanacetum coccineum]
MANLIQDNLALEERLNKQGSRLYNLENLNIPQKVSKVVDEIVTDVVDWAMQAPLRARFSDLPVIDMKEILHQRMFEDNSYKAHKDHKNLFEALQKSLERDYSNQLLADLDEARRKKRKNHASPRTTSGSPPLQPPHPPPPAGASGAPGTSGALGYESAGFTAPQETPPTDYLLNDDSIPDEQVHLSDDEDANALATTYQAPTENSLLEKTRDMRMFMNWYCQKTSIQSLVLDGRECHKMLYRSVDWGKSRMCQVRIDISRPLPLSSPPGHVTIQTQFFFNKDLDYLRYGSKGSRRINGSHNSHALYTHCVVRIKAYSRYGYDYLSKIVLRRADYQEYTIAKKDFKNLYPSDFEDMNLLLLQGHLNHLPSLDKHMLSTVLNLTKPGWDAKGFEYKHDYTIIESPRAVVFLVRNNKRKIMRFNEIYKFSYGMLTHILEALDYRVKEYKVNRLNPGMNTWFWTDKDVTRSKEFIHAIELRLKTRRIYWNLECFVGGRVRDIDYRLLQRTE